MNGLLFLIGVCSLDMYWLGPVKTLNFRTLLIVYALYRLVRVFMGPVRTAFDKASRNAKSQQQEFLLEVLKRNSKTKFAEDYGLKSIDTVEGFFRVCPLTTYSNYKSYVDHIVENGSTDILFPGETDFFATTTGTTSGRSKLYPKNTKLVEKYYNQCMLLLQSVMGERTSKNNLAKVMYPRVGAKKRETHLGVRKCGFSVVLHKRFPFLCSPSEVYDITSERDCLYLHAVFGIADSGAGQVGAVFSTVFLTFMKLIEEEWQSMCDDIQTGKLSNRLSISDDLRQTLEKKLGNGNMTRAEELRSEFREGFDGIVPRIWPDCTCVTCVDSGHFKFAVKYLNYVYLKILQISSPARCKNQTHRTCQL